MVGKPQKLPPESIFFAFDDRNEDVEEAHRRTAHT
jgi:hypothetical protein